MQFDPDPTFHFDAYSDPDFDLAHQCDVNLRSLANSLSLHASTVSSAAFNGSILSLQSPLNLTGGGGGSDPPFDFDPDRAFHSSDADTDPGSDVAKLCGSESEFPKSCNTSCAVLYRYGYCMMLPYSATGWL